VCCCKNFRKIDSHTIAILSREAQLLCPRQGAYRHGGSCDDTLLYAIDTVTKELNQKKIVCCALLDLQKAFDSLDHIML